MALGLVEALISDTFLYLKRSLYIECSVLVFFFFFFTFSHANVVLKKIFTKKELDTYTIKIYLYKDKKFKTLVCENIIPKSSF